MTPHEHKHEAAHEQRQDQMLDQNLRRIAASLRLPQTPAAQRRAWEPVAANVELPSESVLRRGARFMRRHKLFPVTGSAVAAAFVLWAFLLSPSSPAVQAKTILESVRSSVHKGLRVSIANIVVDGASVELTATALFDRPTTLAEFIESDNARDNPFESVFATVQVKLDERHEEVAGLELAAAVAYSHDEQWVYCRFDNLPFALIEEAPPLALFQGMLRSGVLLDLTGIKLGKFMDGDIVEEINDATNDLTIELNQEEDGREPASANAVEALVQDVLRGRAGRAQLDELAKRIEQGTATVTEMDDGTYVLTARDFTEDDPDLSLKNAVLSIGYREGDGVQWVRFEGLGETQGAIRLEFVDSVAPADRPSKIDYLKDGKTRLIEVNKLMPLIEQMIESGGANLDDVQAEQP